MERIHKIIRFLGWAVLTMGLIACAFLWVNDFEEIQIRLAHYSADGVPERFTSDLFKRSQWGVSVLVFAYAFAWILVLKKGIDKKWEKDAVEIWEEWKNKRLLSSFRLWALKEKVELFIILSVALIIRLMYIQQPPRYDEAFTFIEYIQRPFYVVLADWSYPNNHLSYTLLAKICTFLFGEELWVARVPALLAGVLILIPMYCLLRRMQIQRTRAIFGLGLLAAFWPSIEYSVNARGYTLAALCFMVGYLAVSSDQKDSKLNRFLLIATSVCGMGCFATYLICIGILVGQEYIHGKKINWRNWSWVAVLITVVYMPSFITGTNYLLHDLPSSTPWDDFTFWIEDYKMHLFFWYSDAWWWFFGLLLFAPLLSSSLRKKWGLGILCWTLGSGLIGFTYPRWWQVIIPWLMVFMLGVLLKKRAGEWVVFLIVLLMVMGLSDEVEDRHMLAPDHEYYDFEEVAEFLQTKESEKVMHLFAEMPMDYPLRVYLKNDKQWNAAVNDGESVFYLYPKKHLLRIDKLKIERKDKSSKIIEIHDTQNLPTVSIKRLRVIAQ